MTEQFDIMDRCGNPTGLVADKGSALHPGQYYHGTHVYVYNMAMEFLLQQRAYDKEFLPGGWDIVCEHTIAGESPAECAIRGVREEIGLCATENDLQFVQRFIWEEYNHIVDVFFFQTDFDLDKLILEEGKVIGAKKVSAQEMIELIETMHYRPEEYRKHIADEIKCRAYRSESC